MNTLQEKAMLTRLSIGQWTAKKLDKKITKEVAEQHNTTEDAGRYTKALIAKESLDKIAKAANAARQWHYENTLPWLDDGARILPAANVDRYTRGIRHHEAVTASAVEDFLDNYDTYVSEARYRLNGLFNAEDYPPVEQLRRKFYFRHTIDPIPGPEDFRVKLADDEVSSIRAAIEARAEAATADAMRDIWRRVRDVVHAMTQRLADPANKFQDTLVGNIADLVDLLPRLNLTNDPALETVRAELSAKLCKYSPQTLRASNMARQETYENADAILKRMAAYCGD